MINLDKNIPLPGRALKKSYPFAQMEVGDSFFVPDQATVATKHAEKMLGFKFRVRAIDGGCRVWRTE